MLNNSPLYGGDTLKWTVDYQKKGTITYYFAKSNHNFKVVATETTSGLRNFSVQLPDGAGQDGSYTWQARIVDGGETTTIAQGEIEIQKSLKDRENFENQTTDEKILKNINEYLENPNTVNAKATQYNGKSLDRYSLGEIMKIRVQLEQRIKRHKDRMKQRRGETTSGNVLKLKVR